MLQLRSRTFPSTNHAFAHAIVNYRCDQFMFASPRTTLLTAGPVRWLPHGAAPLGERVRQALFDAAVVARADHAQAAHGCSAWPPSAAGPVLVGAIPFDVSQPAQLAVTTRYLQGGPVHATLADVTDPKQTLLHARAMPWPAPQDFETAVKQALGWMGSGLLSKVVLARTLRLQFNGDLNLAALLLRLLRTHPRAYTYAIPAPAQLTGTQTAVAQGSALPSVLDELAGRGSVFVGATPELLVRREGMRVYLNPLAGSAARCPDPVEDAAVAQALMTSEKDLREHAVVIDAIERVLRPLCRVLHVPCAPSLVATDALWHLSTTIEGELVDPALTSFDLALALHPTPAVCGYPRQAAQAAIAELEPFNRALFAGFVGWMDGAGDGEWAVGAAQGDPVCWRWHCAGFGSHT